MRGHRLRGAVLSRFLVSSRLRRPTENRLQAHSRSRVVGDQWEVPLELDDARQFRYATLRPDPELAMRLPEQETAHSELLDAPSVVERRLRAGLSEFVTLQAVEDEAGRAGLRAGVAGPSFYAATTRYSNVSPAARAGRK